MRTLASLYPTDGGRNGDSLALNRALWLERLTILWNAAEAVIAVGAGWLAGSIALVGFGLDSVIETIVRQPSTGDFEDLISERG